MPSNGRVRMLGREGGRGAPRACSMKDDEGEGGAVNVNVVELWRSTVFIFFRVRTHDSKWLDSDFGVDAAVGIGMVPII